MVINNNKEDEISFFIKSGLEIPFKLDRWYFLINNEILWLKQIDSENYEIGTDVLTLYKSGTIKKIFFRSIGSIIDRDKAILRIETDKPGCCGGLILKTFYSPWKIEISEVNEEIQKNYDLITDSPFSRGWIYRVKILTKSIENSSNKGKLISPFNEKDLFKEIRQILRRNKLISPTQY